MSVGSAGLSILKEDWEDWDSAPGAAVRAVVGAAAVAIKGMVTKGMVTKGMAGAVVGTVVAGVGGVGDSEPV